jgi:succinate-acetate transporter protein
LKLGDGSTIFFDPSSAVLKSTKSLKSSKNAFTSKALRSLKSGKAGLIQSTKDIVDHVTTNEPTFPSEHAYREGNATLLGLVGFIGATLPNSLLELFRPGVSQEPLWMWYMGFGGILQVIAAEYELKAGNSLTAAIFATFGFHWIASGLMKGNIKLLESVTSSNDPESNHGCYFIFMTLITTVFMLISLFNPKGSWVLIVTLNTVIAKLALVTIHSWIPDNHAVLRTAGFFGCAAALLAVYMFIADAVAEFGNTTLPTGKFGAGTVTRQEIRDEIDEALNALNAED